MQTISNVSTHAKWKDVFQEAVFELDPTRLQPKLEAAQKAVEDHLGKVISGGGAGLGNSWNSKMRCARFVIWRNMNCGPETCYWCVGRGWSALPSQANASF